MKPLANELVHTLGYECYSAAHDSDSYRVMYNYMAIVMSSLAYRNAKRSIQDSIEF